MRTARAAALIAGNGFVLAQVYIFYFDALKLSGYRRMDGALYSLALVAVLGVAGAYGALAVKSERLAKVLETLSVLAFLVNVGIWFAFGWFGS